MSEEEIIINDIKEIIPAFNNNIASFKSIVHKLERNYKSNKHNIDYLKGDIQNVNKNFGKSLFGSLESLIAPSNLLLVLSTSWLYIEIFFLTILFISLRLILLCSNSLW